MYVWVFKSDSWASKFQSNLEDRQQNSVVEEAFYIMRHNIYIYKTNYWIDGRPWRLRLAEYIYFNSVTLSFLLNSVCE